MKKILTAASIFVIVALGFILLSKPEAQPTPQTAGVNTSNKLSFANIVLDLQKGAQLIDVRTREEFEAGNIESSILLPLQDIERGILPDVQKDSMLYIYCRSGNRSAQAKKLLEKAGYTQVIDLGAMNDVEALGGKVIR